MREEGYDRDIYSKNGLHLVATVIRDMERKCLNQGRKQGDEREVVCRLYIST